MASKGQLLKYKTADELKDSVDKYFDGTNRPTLAGLAYHLGISRQTLYSYEHNDIFLDTIKRAREKVKAIFEERAVYEPNPTGVIFVMKNMGYSDNIKTENKSEHKVEVKAPINWLNPDEPAE